MKIITLAIMPDHIHLFVSALPRYAPAQIVQYFKGISSKWLKKYFSEFGVKGSEVWTRRVCEMEVFKYWKLNARFMIRLVQTDEDLFNLLKNIKDSSVIAISGFNNATSPNYLIHKLWEIYEKTGHPKNLFIETDAFPGIPGEGLDWIGEKIFNNNDQEFISGMLLPYLYRSPYLQKLTRENFFDVYSFSIGVMSSLFREIAAGRPGLITKIGLNTFHDPRIKNSALNALALERKKCDAKLIKINDEEMLFYRAPKPNISFIRGSIADTLGNISMQREGIFGTVLPIVMASKAYPDPGLSFAQIEFIVKSGSILPKSVHVPGPLIDYVVVAPAQLHYQGTIYYDPRISGEMASVFYNKDDNAQLDERMVIKRRVILEILKIKHMLKRAVMLNLGTGLPSEIAKVIESEKLSSSVYLTVESGVWGGVFLPNNDFGLSIGPFAIISQPDQFALYESGIIDLAVLGFLQIDKEGNVNPSMVGDKIPGPGGFTDIANGLHRVYFAGNFTGGKRDIQIRDGKVHIKKDGEIIKFVNKVNSIFFSGSIAKKMKKEVLYITERAVFTLNNDGFSLIEIAPGIDLDKNVLSMMEFKPNIPENIQVMDSIIFKKGRMNIF